MPIVCEQVAEHDVRQLALRFRRARCQHVEAALASGRDRLDPERRFSDPRLALDHERDRPLGGLVENAFDDRPLLFPADDRCHEAMIGSEGCRVHLSAVLNRATARRATVSACSDTCLAGGGDDMAKIVYGLQMTLDGYADHTAFNPSAKLFRHFIEHTREVAGSVYGRTMYEVMRYWDDDQPEWDEAEHEYAKVWRDTPKWVVSSTLESVGPNATLVADDLEGLIRRLKAEHEGEIEVAGPRLAHSVGELGLIDEYRIYLHPVVVGEGKPFFAGPTPPLRLAAHDQIDDDVVRLTYIPA